MTTRYRQACTTLLTLTVGVVAVSGGTALAQEYTGPRTAGGQPDIQGVWTNFDPTPFEAPDDIDLERLAPLAAWFPGTNRPQRPPAEPDPNARSRAPRERGAMVPVTRCGTSAVARWSSIHPTEGSPYGNLRLPEETPTS